MVLTVLNAGMLELLGLFASGIWYSMFNVPGHEPLPLPLPLPCQWSIQTITMTLDYSQLHNVISMVHASPIL